jgi:hypothetical protein
MLISSLFLSYLILFFPKCILSADYKVVDINYSSSASVWSQTILVTSQAGGSPTIPQIYNSSNYAAIFPTAFCQGANQQALCPWFSSGPGAALLMSGNQNSGIFNQKGCAFLNTSDVSLGFETGIRYIDSNNRVYVPNWAPKFGKSGVLWVWYFVYDSELLAECVHGRCSSILSSIHTFDLPLFGSDAVAKWKFGFRPQPENLLKCTKQSRKLLFSPLIFHFGSPISDFLRCVAFSSSPDGARGWGAVPPGSSQPFTGRGFLALLHFCGVLWRIGHNLRSTVGHQLESPGISK